MGVRPHWCMLRVDKNYETLGSLVRHQVRALVLTPLALTLVIPGRHNKALRNGGLPPKLQGAAVKRDTSHIQIFRQPQLYIWNSRSKTEKGPKGKPAPAIAAQLPLQGNLRLAALPSPDADSSAVAMETSQQSSWCPPVSRSGQSKGGSQLYTERSHPARAGAWLWTRTSLSWRYPPPLSFPQV